jgi:hypothetical protein
MVKTNAKRAFRILILTAGLVGTFIAASIPPVPVADGGPIFVCAPSDKKCLAQNPPLMGS